MAASASGGAPALVAALLVACGEGDGASDASSASGDATTASTSASSSSGLVCPAGYAECDGDPATLCEAALETDVERCGACDAPCATAGDNQVDACVAGACVAVCVAPFVDCDGDPANGCETTSSRCGVQTLADVDAPTGLAVADGFVWFGSRGHAPDFLDGYVAKVPAEGGEVSIVAEGQPKPFNISAGGDLLAWSRRDDIEADVGSIWVTKREGGPIIRVAAGVDGPNNPVVVDDVIWFASTDGAVRRAPSDGSTGDTAGEVVATVGWCADLVQVDGWMIWADGGGLDPGGAPLEPSIVSHRRSNGDTTVLATGITAPSFHIAVDQDFVFVGSRDTATLWRVRRNGGGADLMADSFIGSPQELVVDVERRRVYATTGGPTILSFVSDELPATAAVVVDGQVFTSYLTQDDDALYWTDGYLAADGGAIRKAPK
jgi:hypothetical protein